MKKLPVKINSNPVQKQHVRRYKRTGKVVVVNKGNKKRLDSGSVRSNSLGSNPRFKPGSKDNRSFATKKSFTGKRRIPGPDSKDGMKKFDAYTNLLVAAISFPVIAFQGQESVYPKRIADNVELSRMLQLMKDPDDFKEFATDEEAAGFISTMSLVAPLDNDMYDIYLYLFNKVMPRSSIPADLEFVKSLSSQQLTILRTLKRKIRKSQWEVFKKRLKEDKKK